MNVKNVMSNAAATVRYLVNIAIVLSLTVTSYAAENPPDISLPTHFAGNRSDGVGNAPYVPDEVLVKFKEGVPEEKKEQLHGKHGGKKLKEFKELRLHRVKLKEKTSVKEAVADYKSDPDVEYAEPNYIVSTSAVPNDPQYSRLWALSKIQAPSAWDSTTGSQDVVVAVIDTGVDYNHLDLKNNIWTNTLDPVNGLDDDGNGYVDDNHGINAITGSGNPADDNGHGSHVAGTIGASGNNGIGVTGINWSVKIISCKYAAAGGSGSVSDIIEGLEYLKQLKERTQDPVKIAAVNASFGTPQYIQSLYDAIKAMGDTLIVAAAGNDGKNTQFYPASYQLPNIISVAATDSADLLAPFSNYGKYLVHTGAPGVDILSTWPGGQYQSISGTSMAAPHVTGLAALLKAQDPFRTGFQIKNLILSAGDSIPSLDEKTSSGKRINAYASTNCFDKRMLTLGRLPLFINAGESYTLSAYSVNCAAPVGPVTVTASNGGAAELTDGGGALDLVAGDGVFTGTWTAGASPVLLTFTSPEETKTVTVPPLKAAFNIADARVDVPYSQALTATGGWAPYAWVIKSGTLPPGLALDSASGIISGTAGAAGRYNFAAEAVDAKGFRSAATLTMRVVTEQVEQAWGRSFGGDGADEGNAVTTDPDGNSYVAGYVYNGHDYDAVLLKYDRAGQLLWARSYDTGIDDRAYSIARDPSGNLYVAGGKGDTATLLLKYNADGNLIWSQVWESPQLNGRTTVPEVAVDGAGNVYTISTGLINGVGDAVELDRFDSAGSRIWSKTHQSIYATVGDSIAADEEGNVYFGGASIRNVYANGVSTSYYDYLLAKYDSSGNVLWSKTLPEGIWSRVEGLIAHAGNLFATGWTSAASTAYGVTMKFDSAGNLLWKSSTSGDPFFSNAIALSAGDVYVTGELQTASGGVDFQTVKYDALGNEKWRRTMDAGGIDAASGIVADLTGLTVTGYGKSGDNSEIVTVRYNDSKIPVDDLSVTGLSGELKGTTLAYTLTVKNSGTGNPTTSVALRFSKDAVPSPDDYLVTLVNAGIVPGGTVKTLTGSVTVPPSVPSGTYYLTAFADPAELLYETDESNNGAAAAGTYGVIASGSDLQVGALTASLAGGSLTYSVTVKNTGNIAAAASGTGIYLWSGETANRFENHVASVITGAIAAGGEVVLTGKIPLASTIPIGSYWVVAMSDLNNAVQETDETNNGATSASQVTLSNDLSISGLTGSISGGVLSYTVNAKNTGAGNPTTAVYLYLSLDAAASDGNGPFLTQINGVNIPGGSEKTLTGTVAVPTTVPSGAYYLSAVIDLAQGVAESDESNNAAVGPQVSVNRDLKVESVSATVAGGKVTYSVTVQNVGNVTAPSSSTGLYLSADAAASRFDYIVSKLSTLGIAPGAQVVLNGSVALPSTIPAGSYTVAAIADVTDQVMESAEGNNGAVGNQVTVANDLTITGLSGTLDNGKLVYTVKIRNAGTGSAVPGVVLYFSPDAVASSNDYLVAKLTGASIAAGNEQILTGTVSVPGTIPSGTYYLAALADAANAVNESDETNNGAVAETFTVSSDLQVTAVSATLAAGKLTYTVTVANNGNVAAPASSTRLLLSADGTASQAGYSIVSIPTGQLAPGAVATLSGTAALPATIPSGSYSVAAIADAGSVLTESNETNNGTVGNRVTVSNDLSITGLSGTLSNGRLTYTVKVANAGTGSTAAAVGLYFSADQVLAISDYLVTQAKATSVPGGSEVTLTGSVAVPPTIPSGTYYLLALADPDGAATETNESNNGATGAQFTVNSDLRVESVSATLAAGKLSYQVTVRNNGNIGSPSSYTGLYFSVDGTASKSDYSVASISTPPIAAGAVMTLSGTVSVPGTVPPGSYSVAAIADNSGVMFESNESNNGAVGNAVSLSNDLSITGLSGTLSNGRLTYTVKVANAGTGSPGTAVGLYFSADQVPATSDYLVTQVKATSVPGGSEVTLTGSVAVPGTIPSGTYYLVALADPDSAATETNESNNGAAGAQFTVNSDLRVESVSATLAAGKLSYQVTVRNNGNIGSPSSYTGLYLSVDGTASTSDYSVASISTPPIAAGGVTTLSGTASVPGTVPPGSYSVAAIADNSGVMFESNESNNGAVGNAVSLSNDLSITGLSGTFSNGVLSYTVKVGNSGSGNPSAGIALYFSADQVASTSDYLITTKTASIPGGTGATLTGTAAVPAGLPTGTYYLVALADPTAAIPETSESNNGGVGGQFAVNTDLQVDSVSATLAAGKLSYTINVRNNGNISTASTSTLLYLSVDGTVSTSVYSVPVSTGALAPGAVAALKGTVSLPATVAPATYRVAARADSADSMKESNEGNNGALGNQVTLSNDLSITALSGTFSNGQLTYTVKVSNSGTGNPSAGIALYFSADQTAATSDYLVTTRTASIPAGTELTLTGTVTVPSGIPSGTYYLAALADAANAVVEVNESNNSATAGQFTVNSDLQIGAVSGTVTAGVLSYSVTVKNTGNIAAASSSTGVYLSTDATATTSDYKLTAIATPSLAAGAERILTGKVTVPSTVPPGTYFVAAVANATGVVLESNATNNGAVGNTVSR